MLVMSCPFPAAPQIIKVLYPDTSSMLYAFSFLRQNATQRMLQSVLHPAVLYGSLHSCRSQVSSWCVLHSSSNVPCLPEGCSSFGTTNPGVDGEDEV